MVKGVCLVMQIIRRVGLVCIVFVLLFLFRIIILTVPFKIYARRLECKFSQKSKLSLKLQNGYARLIGYTIMKISKYTPWESKCLVQSLATKFLLRRFKIPNTLIIGVGFEDDARFISHAWVNVQNTTIVGNGELEKFKQIKSFTDK